MANIQKISLVLLALIFTVLVGFNILNPLPKQHYVYEKPDPNKPLFYFRVRVLARNTGFVSLYIGDFNKAWDSKHKKVKLKKFFIGEKDLSIGYAYSSDQIPAWSTDDLYVEGVCEDQPVRIAIYVNDRFRAQVDRYTGGYFYYTGGYFWKSLGNFFSVGEVDRPEDDYYNARIFNE